METKAVLQEYGLTEKESLVYLALLPLGSINLQELQKRINLPRTTIYNTLNYLSNKGLVSKIIREHTTFFQATDPAKLRDKLIEKKKLIESILPELTSLKKSLKESSNVEIYEGFKGIYTILSDVFKKKQQTYYFGGYNKSLEILKHLPEHARTMRMDRKIHAKIVIEPSHEEIFNTKSYKKVTELRFLDSMKDFPCMIFIYGNKVAIYTVEGDLIGIIIKNKQIAKAMFMIFNMYWKQSKP